MSNSIQRLFLHHSINSAQHLAGFSLTETWKFLLDLDPKVGFLYYSPLFIMAVTGTALPRLRVTETLLSCKQWVAAL
jgi:hypothetical protein